MALHQGYAVGKCKHTFKYVNKISFVLGPTYLTDEFYTCLNAHPHRYQHNNGASNKNKRTKRQIVPRWQGMETTLVVFEGQDGYSILQSFNLLTLPILYEFAYRGLNGYLIRQLNSVSHAQPTIRRYRRQWVGQNISLKPQISSRSYCTGTLSIVNVRRSYGGSVFAGMGCSTINFTTLYM